MKPVTGIAICVLAIGAWAQDDGGMTAREAFFIKAPTVRTPASGGKTQTGTKTPVKPAESGGGSTDRTTAEPAAPAQLALRYSILQQTDDGAREVDADSEFHSGDKVRVKVESNEPAYLYIVQHGSSGSLCMLFPSREIDGGNNRISTGHANTIPPESGPPFIFDKTAGVEKLSMVLSRSPESDLAKVNACGDDSGISQAKQVASADPIDGSVIGRVRDMGTRDLVFQKYDGATADGGREKAVYYATRNKGADASLYVDLQLIHK
jgi:hypothetical protein